MARVFPVIMIAMSACASAVYLYDGDFRRTIYWAAAAVLTASVTF